MAGWRAVVGLEIHAQILSRSKIFSRGSTEKCSLLNSGIHFFDIGIPGALPILNRRCVEAALISAVTLSARVNRVSYFDRKHYFYPDLPNGYQITQKRKPIAEGGHLDVPLLLQYATALPTVPRSFDNEVLRVDIQRIQLEHDSGKTTYEHYEDGLSATVVDFSRSGCGLMEIVTAPTMCSGAEAASFVKELQLLLRTIKTCDGNMEDGSLRVDANVSVSPLGSDRLGTRSEVKNVSGVRFLARAVDYEINRHVELLESGEEVAEETRFYDERKGITVPTRNKEVYHDYRFLPEPDLPPLCLSDSEEVDDFTVSIPRTTKNLPRIPMVARKDLMKKYGLTLPQASLLLDKQAVVFYETACASHACGESPKEVFKWLTGDLFALCRDRGKKDISFEEISPISPEQLASIVKLFSEESITRSSGQKILRAMAEGNKSLASEIAKNSNLLLQPMDNETLRKICETVIQNHPKEVKQLKDGKVSVLGFLIGSVVKATSGKSKPQEVKLELSNILFNEKSDK